MDRTRGDETWHPPADGGGRSPSGSRDGTERYDQAPDAFEVIDAVGRRADFLMCMRDGSKQKPALQAELGVSRSTVYKAIRELDELRLVERTDRGYRPSLVGRLLLERYEQFCESVETICSPAALLSVLSPECSVPVEFLADAEVVYAEPHAPHQPVTVLGEMVEEATSLYGMSPVVLPSFVELFHDQLVSNALCAELILGSPVVDLLVANYSDEFCGTLETGAFTVWRTDEWLPFGLVVQNEPAVRVGLFVYDRRGELCGLVANDTERAHSWAMDVWTRYRERSTTEITSAEAIHDAH